MNVINNMNKYTVAPKPKINICDDICDIVHQYIQPKYPLTFKEELFILTILRWINHRYIDHIDARDTYILVYLNYLTYDDFKILRSIHIAEKFIRYRNDGLFRVLNVCFIDFCDSLDRRISLSGKFR